MVKETELPLAHRLKVAVEKGEQVATALKAGDLFLGAIPEAEKAGYQTHSSEWRMFIWGYVSVVEVRWPRGVPVDHDRRILPDSK